MKYLIAVLITIALSGCDLLPEKPKQQFDHKPGIVVDKKTYLETKMYDNILFGANIYQYPCYVLVIASADGKEIFEIHDKVKFYKKKIGDTVRVYCESIVYKNGYTILTKSIILPEKEKK